MLVLVVHLFVSRGVLLFENLLHHLGTLFLKKFTVIAHVLQKILTAEVGDLLVAQVVRVASFDALFGGQDTHERVQTEILNGLNSGLLLFRLLFFRRHREI